MASIALASMLLAGFFDLVTHNCVRLSEGVYHDWLAFDALPFSFQLFVIPRLLHCLGELEKESIHLAEKG